MSTARHRNKDNLLKNRYSVTNLEVAILLLHLHAGNYLPDEIGFEDNENTIQGVTRECDTRISQLSREILESALWSANLMDEAGYFWSPYGETFDQFVRRIANRGVSSFDKDKIYFDRVYNVFRQKGVKEDDNVK